MSGRLGILFFLLGEDVFVARFDHSSLILRATGNTPFVGPIARKIVQVRGVTTLIGEPIRRRVHLVSQIMWVSIGILIRRTCDFFSRSPRKKMESYTPLLIMLGYIACVLIILLQIPCELGRCVYCYCKGSCHAQRMLIQPTLTESLSPAV